MAWSNCPLKPYKSIAVDPKIIPWGTLVYIPKADGMEIPGKTEKHNGIFLAQDSGDAIDNQHIDMFSRLGKDGGAYEERLRALAELRAPIARFFDDVLVMAEEPRVRANRLALLQTTLSHFYRIADISRLGGTS